MNTNRRGLFKRLAALALAPVESIRAALPVPKKKITPYVFPDRPLDRYFASDAERLGGKIKALLKKDKLPDVIGFNFSTVIVRREADGRIEPVTGGRK